MSRNLPRLALLCSVVGLVVSGLAAYVHFRMLSDPTYTSFCDVSATVSCTQVYSSRFGSFQGLPVSVFGGIWFTFAALLSLAWMVTDRSDVRESVPGYLFAGSTLALAVAFYLGYASFVILKLVCVLCVITYAAVIGLFLATGAASSLPMFTLPRRLASDLRILVTKPAALALAVLFLGGTAAVVAMFPRDVSASGAAPEPPSQAQQSELERFMAAAPRVPLAISAEGAKVLIVKFADYQCPACGQAYLAYKPIIAKYALSNPGAVKMVMRDYPLQTECNPSLKSTLHPAACDAAVAMRLAQATGKAGALEEWLYTHQPEMTPASVRQAAKDIGGVTDMDAKYAATLDLVKGDVALGKSLGVNQTPTFFMNGIKIDGAWAPQFFDQAIAFELRRAQ